MRQYFNNQCNFTFYFFLMCERTRLMLTLTKLEMDYVIFLFWIIGWTFPAQSPNKMCTWLNLWASQQVRAGSGGVYALEKPSHLVSSDGSTTQHPATCFFQHRLSVRGRHMEPTSVMEPFSGRHMFWGRHMEPTLCYGAFSDVTSWDSRYLLVGILDSIVSFVFLICAPDCVSPFPKPNNLLQIASK